MLNNSSQKKKLVVIGGGASGFFCAVNAARKNNKLEVIILEQSNKILSKVRISGGGRCNVTHSCFDLDEMSRSYPRGLNFVKKTFHSFFTTDTINWFRDRGVELKTEPDGRMFPVSDSSETIIQCLLKEADQYNVQIRMNADVKSIIRFNEQFSLTINQTDKLTADFVCVACGGYPKSSMYDWLHNLGHSFEPPVPSLFTFNLPAHSITELTGISVNEVKIKIEGTKFSETGPVLITHWGLSGPAVLKLSAWAALELFSMNYHFKIHINWLPILKPEELRNTFKLNRLQVPSKKIYALNESKLPNRLWQYLLKESGINEDVRFASFTNKMENTLVNNLFTYGAEVKGKTTYKEEFVTAGGISLSEINHATMMSKKVPHLYFTGEILNVDGITGGYNFQHAWTTGWIASDSIANET